mmetsp:Transcript_82490/g.233337  ORF Transcript_82490/g.233337 Transcript_82490/m.233337 type:complete len:189 (+) Transcript_82490:810-1376(+)
MLGDGGRSYVIGFGSNSPRRPHHAASTCACTGCCDWDTYNADADNCQTLTGALVGGPGSNDDYDDDRTNYYNNEVATDYNAAFQSAIASLELKYGTGTYSNSDAEKVCSSTPMCDGNQMYNYFGEGWPTCNFWTGSNIAWVSIVGIIVLLSMTAGPWYCVRVWRQRQAGGEGPVDGDKTLNPVASGGL